MATYFFSYDIHKGSEHDYKSLYKALENHGAIRVLESVWCFKASNTSVKELRDFYQTHLHRKDRLIVIEATSDAPGWSGWTLMGSPNDL